MEMDPKTTHFLSPHSITKRAPMHFWSTIPVQYPAGQVAKMDDGHEDNICLDISTPTSCRRAEGSLHAWQGNTVRRALCTYVGKGLKWVPNRSMERNVCQSALELPVARFGPHGPKCGTNIRIECFYADWGQTSAARGPGRRG